MLLVRLFPELQYISFMKNLRNLEERLNTFMHTHAVKSSDNAPFSVP